MSDKCTIKTSIGGQALIEGIMMRGPKVSAMAVRRPDGSICLEKSELKPLPRASKIPVVRGVVSFVSSLAVGYRSLMRSAEIAMPDELKEGGDPAEEDIPSEEPADAAETAAEVAENAADAAETEVTGAGTPSDEENADETAQTAARPDEEKNAPAGAENKSEKSYGKVPGMTAIMIVSVVLALGLSIVLFKVIPESVYQLLCRIFPGIDGDGWGYSLLRSAITGIMKIMILIGYMAAVSLMKDIRRTFMYHGAEHKTIFCYEKGEELTVENVRIQKRFHPRCGTSFLILSVLVSIFFTMFIPAKLVDNGALNVIARTGVSLLLLPLIMGFGYELIRLAGRHDNLFTRIISAPGVWLQHITTKEPDDGMIECAIAAVREVIPDDGSDRIG